MKKPKVSDLGIIRVETTGNRDMVFLAHNNLRCFVLTCNPGKGSTLVEGQEFALHDEAQRVEVFRAYDAWKRTRKGDFKLPQTMTKDGHTHPWRSVDRAKRHPAKPKPEG